MGLDLLIDVREGFITVWTWNIPQLFYGSPVTFIHGILMFDRLITHVCNRRVPQFASSSGGTQNNEAYNLIILRSQSLWKHRVLPNYFRSLQPATPSTANLAMPSRARWQRDVRNVRKQYEHLIVKEIYRRLNTDDHKQRMLTTDSGPASSAQVFVGLCGLPGSWPWDGEWLVSWNSTNAFSSQGGQKKET